MKPRKIPLQQLPQHLGERILSKMSAVTFIRFKCTNSLALDFMNQMTIWPHFYCSKVQITKPDVASGFRVFCVFLSSSVEADVTDHPKVIKNIRTWDFRVNGCPNYFAKTICPLLAPLLSIENGSPRQHNSPKHQKKEPVWESRLKAENLRHDVFLLFLKKLKPTLVYHANNTIADSSNARNIFDSFLEHPLAKGIRNLSIQNIRVELDSLERFHLFIKEWTLGQREINYLEFENIEIDAHLNTDQVLNEVLQTIKYRTIWRYVHHSDSCIAKVPREKMRPVENVVLVKIYSRPRKESAMLAVTGNNFGGSRITLKFILMNPDVPESAEVAHYMAYLSYGHDDNLRKYFRYMLNFWRME